MADLKNLITQARDSEPRTECVLKLAIRAGNVDTVRTLLDAGADVRYTTSGGCGALLDAMFARMTPARLAMLRLLIDRGADLNIVTTYNESPLRVASSNGHFDAVRLLLDAGADPAPLGWTPLMYAVALGTLEDVQSQLQTQPDLAARDRWSRTPWLLSLETGDILKAKALLAAGASRLDRGNAGQTPLMYPLARNHAAMLQWLLAEGFDPDEADEYDNTPLMRAAEAGATDCVRVLLDAGADIHRTRLSERAITVAANLDIVHLLVARGANINEISSEMRAVLTRLPADGRLTISPEDYRAQKHRRFGQANPERMNFPFWKAMVTSGLNAYAAREHFEDRTSPDDPVWCFDRFGKSITRLPDGRIIEIAGEHEDSYDPDFCIYNDVIVHRPDGTFDIYGYPEDLFPPTDFHTATLVGNALYIIGSLGYHHQRRYGLTPVYRLDLDTLAITPVLTSGDMPGRIHRHTATRPDQSHLHISGGKICTFENNAEQTRDNPATYSLHLTSLTWQKLP